MQRLGSSRNLPEAKIPPGIDVFFGAASGKGLETLPAPIPGSFSMDQHWWCLLSINPGEKIPYLPIFHSRGFVFKVNIFVTTSRLFFRDFFVIVLVWVFYFFFLISMAAVVVFPKCRHGNETGSVREIILREGNFPRFSGVFARGVWALGFLTLQGEGGRGRTARIPEEKLEFCSRGS